jgi:F0F1-type ATP synthase delta subunit
MEIAKEKILQDLKEKIITSEDLSFLIEEINLAKSFSFKDSGLSLSEKLKERVSENFRVFVWSLEKEKLLPETPKERFSFFDEIEEELRNLPKVKIEISFEPSRNFLLQVKNWFRENLKKEVILEVIKNPKVVGGAIVEYQGKYLDFSLAKEIDRFFAKKHGGI